MKENNVIHKVYESEVCNINENKTTTYLIIVFQHNAPTRLSFYVFTATSHLIFLYIYFIL